MENGANRAEVRTKLSTCSFMPMRWLYCTGTKRSNGRMRLNGRSGQRGSKKARRKLAKCHPRYHQKRPIAGKNGRQISPTLKTIPGPHHQEAGCETNRY